MEHVAPRGGDALKVVFQEAPKEIYRELMGELVSSRVVNILGVDFMVMRLSTWRNDGGMEIELTLAEK